jgi:hypothetical protein
MAKIPPVQQSNFSNQYVKGTTLNSIKNNGTIRVQTDNDGHKQSLFSFNAKDGTNIVRTDGAIYKGGGFNGNGTQFYKYVDDGDKTRGDKQVMITEEEFKKYKAEEGYGTGGPQRDAEGHIIVNQTTSDYIK